jgi:hypothetical protein
MELRTFGRRLEPLNVQYVFSQYFGDPSRFAVDKVVLDSTLFMRNVPHEWRLFIEAAFSPNPQFPRLARSLIYLCTGRFSGWR